MQLPLCINYINLTKGRENECFYRTNILPDCSRAYRIVWDRTGAYRIP